MTPQEFQYLKRAVEALENGDLSPLTQHKVLRVMSQISAAAAQRIEDSFNDRVDQNMANAHLMKALKDA
jgi:hypothetical protein